ncbi:alpha/beta fold hydrolase [Caenimonas koreensis DSM 17982]|uniref:Alpha/beta fold hydrolase n=2 Tax=Caenimonas TaxID=763439 RepID=A0A844B0H6_9BURK|nr:alpha/beta fold hydrolase [Caenimonas koreensis DSM 17982]
MLHGIGGGHLAFAPQVETLASSGYRAVAWDMPGYGHSAPIEPYTFKGLAQSCITLIEALQCGDVTLIGHSMGGMVAQEVMARRPELVNKLVLSGTSPAFGKSDGNWQREFIAQRTAPLDAGKSMAQLAETLIPQMIGPGALPEGVHLATHCMSMVPPATYRRALEALVTFDRRAELARISVPTLVLAGEFDKVAPPAVMKKMADAIPGSTYIELKGAGHLANLEVPDDFDGMVLNFLALPRALHH